MHASCLVAEFESWDATRIAIEVLRTHDFHSDALSLVWKGHEGPLGQLERSSHDDGDSHGIEKSMGIGAAIAAVAGIPLGITSVMGPIMVAGPLAAAAGGAALGGVAAESSQDTPTHQSAYDRANTQGLFAMAQHRGLHEHDAAHYEDRVRSGDILLIITSTPPRLDVAQRALMTTGPVSLKRFERRTTVESK